LYSTQAISLSPERQQKVLRSLELQMDRKHKPKTDSLNRVLTEMFDDRPYFSTRLTAGWEPDRTSRGLTKLLSICRPRELQNFYKQECSATMLAYRHDRDRLVEYFPWEGACSRSVLDIR
jgi:hypothetical protein